MDRCALFVDASYVLADGAMAVHGTRRGESVSWDYEGLFHLLSSVARERTGLPLLRCYWYEATVDGRRTAEQDALADIPGIKLRVAKIRPGRREGVDTEIHRDLTTLARNNAISDALVVSAEEDLAQVIADVQDLGMRVTLVHLAVDGNWTISRALRQESDDIIEIGGEQLRPYVELIVGAEPAPSDEATRRTRLTCRSTRPGGRWPTGTRRPAGPTSRCPPGRSATPRPSSTPRPWWRSTSGPPRSCPGPAPATTVPARTVTATTVAARTGPARTVAARTGHARSGPEDRAREDRPRESINGEAQPSRPEGYAGSVPPARTRPDRPEPGPSSRPRSDDLAGYAGPQNGAEVTPGAPGAPGTETQAPAGQLRRLPTRPGSPPPIAPVGPVGPASQSAQHSQYAATGLGPQRPLHRAAAGRHRAAARLSAGGIRGLTY